MEIVKPSAEIVNPVPYETMLDTVEHAIRNCYQSQDKIKEGSAEAIIKGCIARSHFSPLEFGDIVVKLVGDRGLMAQITRHRLASFCISSTRYCNFSKDKFGESIKVIVPQGLTNEAYETWRASMLASEAAYMIMTKDQNMKAEVARSVLPHSLATTIYMKANIREWRHIFELRASKYAQTDIRLLMTELLDRMYEIYPIFFEDLWVKYCSNQDL